ncbi:MAG: beta-ketoacyl-[acyl-carrier-protein] synthase family protein [Polyangiaceae bacterium]|nr:beta-ketoacyl-[acyl-carrier-protein] synthase family protein [Polyangiaceae bacterium]MCW5790828.1 beta-ketoacyl-[acyl-carrier-protein] synthase family protein [Polyangiaceae bacterium]
MTREVAVTGLGVITALGQAQETFARLAQGESALSRGAGQAPVARCALPPELARLPRTEALSLAALVATLIDAGLEEHLLLVGEASGAEAGTEAGSGGGTEVGAHSSDELMDSELGLVWGTTTGGLAELEPLLGLVSPETPDEELTALLGFPISRVVTRARQRLLGVGPARTVCSACSSGALAVAVGAEWIRSGRVARVLVGGADALCQTTSLGFGALGLLDPQGGRPFARSRAGLSLGEGAGALVLESLESAARRGARVRGYLCGVAVGSEAHHVTQPDPAGRRAAALIQSALSDAGFTPDAVGYVNAHGTGTPHNDAAERVALEAVFGSQGTSADGQGASEELRGAEQPRAPAGAPQRAPRVASSKGQLGHLLGGSGAVEAVITVQALEAGVLPPNVAADLEPWSALIGSQAETAPCEVALSNSFGFGGMGAVLCFARSAPARLARTGAPRRPAVPVYLARSVLTRPGEGPLGAHAPGALPERAALLDAARSRRFDPLSTWIAWLTSQLLPEGGDDETALAHGTAFGLIEPAARFLARARVARPAPADFPNLLPSAASGNAALYSAIRGPVAAVSAGAASAHAAAHQAIEWVAAGVARRALSCAAEPLDPLALRVAAACWDAAPTEWAAAGQLWCRAPQPIQVVAFGDGLTLPRAPSGVARALLASDDGSLAWDDDGWGELERPRLCSVEGLGNAALARAAERLLTGELSQALVVDVREGRLSYTQLARVEGAEG